MNNPNCTHNFPLTCEECGYFWPEEDGHPVCHNDGGEGFVPGAAAVVAENDEGVVFCRNCGEKLEADAAGDFPDTCFVCGGNLDWSKWEEDEDAKSGRLWHTAGPIPKMATFSYEKKFSSIAEERDYWKALAQALRRADPIVASMDELVNEYGDDGMFHIAGTKISGPDLLTDLFFVNVSSPFTAIEKPL